MNPQPHIVNPFIGNALKFQPNEEYLYYVYSYFLLKAEYFQTLRTNLANMNKWKDYKAYTRPYYHFFFNDINTGKFLKKYTYEEIFTLAMIASNYGSPINIPHDISILLSPTDLELILLISIVASVLKIENSVMLSNQYRQNGREYFFTFTIPENLQTSVPAGQLTSFQLSDRQIITLAHNAPTIFQFYGAKYTPPLS
jgi:hypothetical protein